jgi:NAD(P)-dependent dehydrogenase (short-subunit alcohol dehydrogenase family)
MPPQVAEQGEQEEQQTQEQGQQQGGGQQGGEQQQFPPQEQSRQPGIESQMTPEPLDDDPEYRAAGKLEGKVALITGGDSGIGRAVAICYAKEGADVAILYLDEHDDAEKTKQSVEKYGRRCLTIAGDVGDPQVCKQAVARTVRELGGLDILVNNAAEQHPKENVEEISPEQLEKTFRTNIFGYFYMTQAAVPHLKEGSAIINTTSVTAYRGSGHLMDYASTKGAIVAFTRSLSEKLIEKGIRVNGVAPGPIWTPLIPATFPADQVAKFGADTPMKRAGQPAEIAPAYVFLASRDSSYIAGTVIHPNGGEPVES